MTRNQDARPFVDLLKDSEEFKAKFDEDIKKCINFLDAKITALICDPDSLGNQLRGIKQNPLVEFSKAKYDIFIGTKALMSEMEREWLKYISEMKKLFIENVEIFLAATKLEVKLPSNEFQSSPGFTKSPRKQEQSYITSSIYPIINTFAKNVAALGSPLRGKDSPQKKTPKRISQDFQVSNSTEISDDESKDTGTGRKLMRAAVRITKDKATESAAKGETDTDESESEHKTTRSSGRFNKSSSSGLNSSRLSSGQRSKSGSDIEFSPSPGLNRSRSSSGQRGKTSVESKLNNLLGRNRSKSSSKQRSRSSSEKRLSRSGKGKSSSTSEEDEKAAEVKLTKQKVSTTEESQSQTDDETSKSPLKGRKEKQVSKSEPKESSDTNRRRSRSSTTQSKSSEKQNISTAEESGSQTDGETSKSPSRGRQKTRSSKDELKAKQNLSTTEESESQAGDETSKFPLRGRKGRQSSKVESKVKQKVSSTEESEMSQIHTDNEPSKTSRKRKGRQPSKDKSKDNNVPSKTPNRVTRNTTVEIPQSDNNVPSKTPNRATRRTAVEIPQPASSPKKINTSNSVESIESESSHTSLKRGRSKPSAKQKSSAKQKISSTDESTATEVEEAPPGKQRGRKSTKNKSKDTSEESELLGRGGWKDVSGIPKSPKKVTFTKEHDISDDLDLDIYTPAKQSKPSVRRKTLLPNLDDISDISPEIPTRTKGKRKTIGGVSDLKAITPSKRLKVSESKKSKTSAQEDDEADDNLLGSSGNYSEWMSLKNVDAKIPTRPAIYEIKVWRAKKSAYIGCCESLRQTLTLYKLRQNSGHKHLDKFIDRNMNDIQIRYEAISSLDAAKSEVKNRINSFVSQYKTTPAYN